MNAIIAIKDISDFVSAKMFAGICVNMENSFCNFLIFLHCNKAHIARWPHLRNACKKTKRLVILCQKCHIGGNKMREHDLNLLRIRLQEIKEMGWVKNQRPGNAGGVGNTLEDLLDVAENNLQLPDFGDWELKSQRAETGSLLTLFHSEPKPRNARIVPQILLLLYGWPHQDAGTLYPTNERSFRQTINAASYSARGFKVNIDWNAECIFVSFDYQMIDNRYDEWRRFIKDGVGTEDIDPNPYWTFADISQKLNTKLNNLMYVKAETRYISGNEYFKYNEIEAYVDPTLEKFLNLVESGEIYVDFDARTGHNHRTKFRIRPAAKKELYQQHIVV